MARSNRIHQQARVKYKEKEKKVKWSIKTNKRAWLKNSTNIGQSASAETWSLYITPLQCSTREPHHDQPLPNAKIDSISTEPISLEVKQGILSPKDSESGRVVWLVTQSYPTNISPDLFRCFLKQGSVLLQLIFPRLASPTRQYCYRINWSGGCVDQESVELVRVFTDFTKVKLYDDAWRSLHRPAVLEVHLALSHWIVWQRHPCAKLYYH